PVCTLSPYTTLFRSLPYRGVVVQQVVEIPQVGQADARGRHRRAHTGGPHLVERLAQVERVGDRVEHRLGGHVTFARVERRRQLRSEEHTSELQSREK